jgi:homoserine dehydrogenase
VNFILSRLARGDTFDAALEQARKAGFAEEDCEADVSGADAAAKLRLIAHRAFGVSPEEIEISTEALDEAALQRIGSSRWVQVARLSRDGGRIEASVRLVPASELAELEVPGDEWNCARIETLDGLCFTACGRGAGGAATAEAIVADLYDLIAAPPEERPRRRVRASGELVQTTLCA